MGTRGELSFSGGYQPAPPGIVFTGIDPRLGAPISQYCYTAPDEAQLLWITEHASDATAPTASGLAPRRYWLWREPGKWTRYIDPPTLPPLWYRLNEVNRSRGRVWIFATEAECDAFTLACPGEVATTWSYGERRIGSATWGSLSGRQCYVWPPPSPTSGGVYLKGAQKLSEAASAVWIVPTDAYPGLPPAPDLPAIIASAIPVIEGAPTPTPSPKLRVAESAAMRQQRWGLIMSPSSTPYCNVDNAARFLQCIQDEGHPDAPQLWFDDLSCQMRGRFGTEEREVGDADMIEMLRLAQGLYGGMPHMPRPVLEDAALFVAMKKRKNPYREWFLKLPWDGERRLESVFKRAWKSHDNDYVAACSRVFFLQFAKRVLEPGCKADYMIVFEGKTGCGKTTSLEALFGLEYVDSPTHMWGEKDFYLGLLGRLCIEVAEFAGLSGRMLDVAKNDISRKVDRFRPPFGRKPMDFPRHCIFVGTTERDDWNRDEMMTMRRFMPIRCTGQIDRELIEKEHLQWFAEARERVRLGECAWNIPMELATVEHLARVEEDVIDAAVAAFLQKLNEVRITDLIRDGLGIMDISKWTPQMQHRIIRSLRKLGWHQIRESGERVWRRIVPLTDLPSDRF